MPSNPGAIWIQRNWSELADGTWVAATDQGLIASSPRLEFVMETVAAARQGQAIRSVDDADSQVGPVSRVERSRDVAYALVTKGVIQ